MKGPTARPATRLILLLGTLALLGALYVLRERASQGSFPAASEGRLRAFLSNSAPRAAAYDNLFLYFVEGFETYRSAGGARAAYPGLRSRNGMVADGLEGFSRVVPLMGAWVRSGRPSRIALGEGRAVDLSATFQRGLIAGTDRRSPEYWGDIRDLDQRIVEAADIGLALWLFRDSVWGRLAPVQRDQVVGWLRQVERRRVSDNNWHLFPVFVSAVLRSLGEPAHRTDALRHYARFKQFYRGRGWFSDGPSEIFDYYNAWSMHYTLYWLARVDPDWDPLFIAEARRQFLATYRYLLGPSGFPIMGRSVCYRMAAPAILVLGQQTDPDVIAPAEARRALDAIWSYFIARGAVESGRVTQGYCGTDARVLDNYSGPASCQWALRSLIAAFAQPANSAFWTTAPGRLPVEQASYTITIPEACWTIVGKQTTGAIRIHKPGASPKLLPLTDYGWARQLASTLLWRPFRPDNHDSKYTANTYDSAQPFCGCAP